MQLVPYDKAKLGTIKYRRTKNQAILEEFVNSGVECVEIVNFPYRSAKYGQASLMKTVERLGYRVLVTTRKDRLFLIKES